MFKFLFKSNTVKKFDFDRSYRTELGHSVRCLHYATVPEVSRYRYKYCISGEVFIPKLRKWCEHNWDTNGKSPLNSEWNLQI